VNPQPILLVGYSLAWQDVMTREGATDPVVFVEEPDVARKRNVDEHLAGSDAELIRWEYQLAGAADRFYIAHRDLDPVAILPGVEYAVPFAARLAERYGVAGAGLGAATLLSDKALLRTVTREAGIPNPRSERVRSPGDVRAFMLAFDGPIVLKPANRQASVGTQVVDDPDAIDAAWRECTQQDEGIYAPDREKPVDMLAEQFVAGDEFSVELLIRDGEPLFANVTEKHLFEGPRPIELGHAVPAPIAPALADLLVAQTRRVLDAVGFASGFVHCEWIVMRGVPYLVECAGRMPGDLIVPMIDQAWQTDVVAAFATVMRGELPAPLPTRAAKGSGVCFIRADPGEVVSVGGLEEARALDGVLSAGVLVAPGDRVNDLRSSWDRVGWVNAVAATPQAALELAKRAAALITVDVLTDAIAHAPLESTR
jgi:biotin carboxylase